MSLTLKLLLTLVFLNNFAFGDDDVGKLPHCVEDTSSGLLLVSTIDGQFTALNSEGQLEWQIDTDPGPLLTSNIHNLELTNSGKWVRIIPSLTGTLYRFDGTTIDPIPISAESLLKSSFKYSDDLVIAGGMEVRTYGVGLRTGQIFYTCSTLKCTNNTENDQVDDILLIERSTQIVRAIEPHSGNERWNFSVGYHNIKVPQVSCINASANLFNWNLTVIIPDGLILASTYRDNVKISWQYQFPSPIVRVWKWNGYKLHEVDLFSIKNQPRNSAPSPSPSIYIGMHKKQLYIHESNELHGKLTTGRGLIETASLTKIPWKPIAASGLITEEDSTALSVLYNSEYVNGNGYYLFSEASEESKNKWCGNNKTLHFPALTDEAGRITAFGIFQWWKEILALLTTISFLGYFCKPFGRQQHRSKDVIYVDRPIPMVEHQNSERYSESSDGSFNSRYLNDFDTLRCLGKGGFGVVFEVKQKYDECHYAVKRIILPDEENKRETVMREVKALAKLEHHNIVRYFNCWVEKPPCGWQQDHDRVWLKETLNEFGSEVTSPALTSTFSHKEISTLLSKDRVNEASDSFIVFDSNDKSEVCGQDVTVDDNSNNTSCDTVSASVDWKRPERRHHDWANPPVLLYIQMQLCQKHSLKEWLVENPERNLHQVLNIFKQILSAVEYVHLQGLIHRDLKPSNIFFSMDGQVKVGDFGLVKDVEESLDIPNGKTSPAKKGHTREVGTRLYMSPEQLVGSKYNYKVDIYSLGLIFYELLVHFSTDMERIRTLSQVKDNIYPQEFISKYREEHELLTRMLCKQPEKRLTTFGIRARPPINSNTCENYSQYDFELPKNSKGIISKSV